MMPKMPIIFDGSLGGIKDSNGHLLVLEIMIPLLMSVAGPVRLHLEHHLELFLTLPTGVFSFSVNVEGFDDVDCGYKRFSSNWPDSG